MINHQFNTNLSLRFGIIQLLLSVVQLFLPII
jgi:hypothetical protein